MSKGGHDIFALVINFLESDYQPKQVTIGLLEAIETILQTLTNNLTKLLDQYGLRNKVITYIKDEGSNLYSMTTILKFVVKFEVFSLDENFQSSYFGHDLSKACQYATTNEIFCKNFKFVSIKSTESNL